MAWNSPFRNIMALRTRADDAMNADPTCAVRSSCRKDLIKAAEWSRMPREVAHMEYYGQPRAPKLPGNEVLDALEQEVVTGQVGRSGSTPPINRYRNRRPWSNFRN